MSRRYWLVSALLMVSVSAGVFAATNMQTITQKGRAFSAKSLQMIRGGVVRFDNVDTFIHQIYVESPTFSYDSNEQSPGEQIDITFPKSGTFEVRCHIHPKMLLNVEVQ